ncbi:MAG: recombinase family protein [Elusimicrobia bacterium]|nr:recombinase family protein [Elusimicrobiota bacterium]
MTRAWAFYRRSTDKQELSIEDQKKACRDYADQKGWGIVREFIPEKGYASGLTIERDSRFQEMIRLAQAGGHGISHLLVYDVSRLGRLPAEDKIYWEQALKRAGVWVVYVKDEFKNDGSLGDSVSKLIKHAQAHEYSQKLSETTIRGCKSHASLGRSCGGRPPYGYARLLVNSQQQPIRVLNNGERKAEKSQHVVWTPGSADEVEVVRSIFQAYDRGNGLGAIVDDLNSRSIPAPHGGLWAKNSILSLLKNQAYKGTLVYNRHNYHNRSPGAAKRIRASSEWIIKENSHPAIIDPVLFNRIQARFRRRKPRDGRHYDSPYLLGGLIKCARCGHRYYGQMKYHDGEKAPYYQCGGYHNKGKYFCAAFSIKAKVLDDFVLAEIQRGVSELKDTNLIRTRLRELLEESLNPSAKDRAEEVRKAVEAKDGEIRNLVGAIKMGSASQFLVDELKRLEAEKERLGGHLSAISGSLEALSLDPDKIADELVQYFDDFPRLFGAGTRAEQKDFVKGFVQEIEIAPDPGEARFNFYPLPFLEKRIADSMGTGDSFRRDRCGGWI